METQNKQKKKHKMIIGSHHMSIITLNVNELNSLIKRLKVAGWIKIHDSTICCPQKTHLSYKDEHRQSEGVEDKTLRKCHPEKSRCSHIYIRQNGFQDKIGNKRQRWIFNYDKVDTTSRRHNTLKKYIVLFMLLQLSQFSPFAPSTQPAPHSHSQSPHYFLCP